jgi:zinc D-Ala-D-Ala dipeptidase
MALSASGWRSMKFLFFALVIVVFATSSRGVEAPADFINLSRFDFSIPQDLRYASSHNFAHRAFYSEPKCLLRRPVAQALARAQATLKLQGFGLKIYDCYRPLSIQKQMFLIHSDKVYVGDPEAGNTHTRAASVDVSLLDSKGDDVEMPSRFEDFSPNSARNNKKMTAAAKKNLDRLDKAMIKEGFVPSQEQWWHFDIKNAASFSIEDVPFDSVR